MERTLSICGLGVTTDAFSSVRDLSDQNASCPIWHALVSRLSTLEPSSVAGHDVIAQLAIRALHQAWTMADLRTFAAEKIGLIFQTSWGMIDSTVAYLESMLADDGKYASPRHFSRSVYSSAASVTAIHFSIKGPCETLTFEREALSGPLGQAWRLLAARRCDRVAIIWAEEANEVAADLAKRAAKRLHRKEFERYTKQTLGQGAVAIVVGLDGGAMSVNLEKVRDVEPAMVNSHTERPFAMDPALQLAKQLLSGDVGRDFAAS